MLHEILVTILLKLFLSLSLAGFDKTISHVGKQGKEARQPLRDEGSQMTGSQIQKTSVLQPQGRWFCQARVTLEADASLVKSELRL